MKLERMKMPGWLVFVMIFGAYIAIMRWALPALGIQT
jgi:hypothetical protein